MNCNSLWASVIVAIHGYSRGSSIDPLCTKKGGVWERICGIGKDLENLFGAGFNLFEKIDLIPPCWVFWVDNGGKFSVASARKKIDDVSLPYGITGKTIWIKWIPGKVNIFLWRLIANGLPTVDNLTRRNVNVNSILCPLCGFVPESIDHLFIQCRVVLPIWMAIGSWCRITFHADSVSDLIAWGFRSCLTGKKAQSFSSICAAVLWNIYKHRNALVFKELDGTTHHLFDKAKEEAFWWLKARKRLKYVLSWESWCNFPFDGVM